MTDVWIRKYRSCARRGYECNRLFSTLDLIHSQKILTKLSQRDSYVAMSTENLGAPPAGVASTQTPTPYRTALRYLSSGATASFCAASGSCERSDVSYLTRSMLPEGIRRSCWHTLSSNVFLPMRLSGDKWAARRVFAKTFATVSAATSRALAARAATAASSAKNRTSRHFRIHES
jgi:hypothetical protein